MKKTLIALAVAASAAVSGSAMAWTANGTGGSVNLGGTLTPVEKVTPWEVKVGDAVTGLDAQIAESSTVVKIPVEKMISVLGIRTNSSFPGQLGIDPEISYGGKVNIDGFDHTGQTTLTLDVMSDGKKIGTMASPFWAAAQAVWKSQDGSAARFSVYAPDDSEAFFGGLGKTSEHVSSDAWNLVAAVFPDAEDKYDTQGVTISGTNMVKFDHDDTLYNAFYGSGIQAGSVVTINLDSPATKGTDIAWTATLPVQVAYN